jgi:hypothetical protein
MTHAGDVTQETEPFPKLDPEKLMKTYNKLHGKVTSKLEPLSDKYLAFRVRTVTPLARIVCASCRVVSRRVASRRCR